MRRGFLVALVALALAGGARAAEAPTAAPAPKPKAAAQRPAASAALRDAAARLDTAVRDWIRDGVARRDGHVYGMDVVPLLLYAAERRDEALYTALHAHAVPLVTTGEPDTAGFVVWRRKDGGAPEVSGAAETVLLARALWTGSRAFRRAEDRALAVTVLEGYARHAATVHGTWLVRKYYAFGTKSFASLSVLPGYQADFVSEIEAAAPKARGLGQRSYQVVQRAVTPSKLLAPLIQPEIGVGYPNMNVHRYAPNNLVPLEDACVAAEGAARGLPDVARQVLAFAGSRDRLDANGRLLAYYHRRTGVPIGSAALSSTGYACLGRLAATLGDRKAAAALEPALVGDMIALADAPQAQAAPLYAAGPLLRAALALQAFPAGSP